MSQGEKNHNYLPNEVFATFFRNRRYRYPYRQLIARLYCSKNAAQYLSEIINKKISNSGAKETTDLHEFFSFNCNELIQYKVKADNGI